LQLGAFDGVVHAAGRALGVIAAACMQQVVGIGETQPPAFTVPESWVPWAAPDGSEDSLLFCCCSCIWIASEVRDTHSRLLSLRVLDLISDVFEYLPAVISVASMQQQQQRQQRQQQQQQQLLEQRAVLLERCSGALQHISMNASANAGGEFAGVRLMAAVRAFSEGRLGGKTMDEARQLCCCDVGNTHDDVARDDDDGTDVLMLQVGCAHGVAVPCAQHMGPLVSAVQALLPHCRLPHHRRQRR